MELGGKFSRFVVCFWVLAVLATGVTHAVDPATIPEIENFQFTTSSDFQWDPAPPIPVDVYHVYRGDVTNLPFLNYGGCFQPNLPIPFSGDVATPAVGGVFTYLVTGGKASVEGTMGFDSAPTERPNLTPCPIPPLSLGGPLNPNGPDPILLDGVLQGVNAPRNPAIGNELNGLAGGGLYLHTLEFIQQIVDMEVPGRGMSWRHSRTYRSQISYDGPQGFNWIHNYERRILPSLAPGNLLYQDGAGREDEYVVFLPGLWEPALRGIYNKIRQNPAGGFTLRERDGTLYHHFDLDGSPIGGKLEAIEDRYGNRLSFLYHEDGNLCNVVDTMGRTYSYYYDGNGHLESVVDYTGREVRYTYGVDGDLVEARTPVVVGTPNGNDFPVGKTTQYTYSSGFATQELNHNLLTITAPGDANPYLENFYLPGIDIVERQFFGGTNATGIPAGGLYLYNLLPLGGGFRELTLFDRNGIQNLFTLDPAGHMLEETILTIPVRVGDPPGFTTVHAYNNDGERTQTFRPGGNSIQYVYDDLNFDLFQHGNLLQIIRVVDPVRGDGFGGFLPDISVTYEYDPMYTMQRTITDPVGRQSTYTYDYQEGDPVFNGVIPIATDWQINLGPVPLFLGDVNADGTDTQIGGNPIRLEQPTVSVLAGGRQDGIGGPNQFIETIWRYNDLGQLVLDVEAEKNVTLYEYYPEIQPSDGVSLTPAPLDGRLLDAATGGYLRLVVKDADPTGHISAVDLASRNNGTNPTPAAIENFHVYDPVGNLVRSINGNGVATRYDVNQLGQIVQVTRDEDGLATVSQQFYNERSEIEQRRVLDSVLADGFFDVVFQIDILGNVVSQTQDASDINTAVTEYTYDSMERRIATTFPEGNIFTMQFDERDLLFNLVRGDNDLDASNGGPVGSSQQTVNYDPNGNPVEFVDGRGQSWEFFYDGVDRRVVSTIDPNGIGTFFTTLYNPDETPSLVIVQDGLGTVYHQTFYAYDAMSRVRSISSRLLDDTATAIAESVDGDEFLVTSIEYDRNSRRSRSYADGGPSFGSRFDDIDYDGAGRVIDRVDFDGNQIEYVYDANNNLLRTTERENTLVGVEKFVNTYVYDNLDRRTLSIDPIGGQRELTYDDRDSVIGAEDTLGNTTTYAYDGMGRRTLIIRDLRAGGVGGGAVFDQIVHTFEYDLNGRATILTDAESNSTQYLYDDLNRLREQKFADGTSMLFDYDANDNVTKVTDPNGSIIDITYDSLDRPIQRVVIPAPLVFASTQSFAYDRFNRLTLAVDTTGTNPPITTEYVYDSMNRIRREVSTVGLNPSRELKYTYDANGNRDTATVPTGGPPNLLTYAYDGLDRVISIQDTDTGFLSIYDYLGPERIAFREGGNSIQKSYMDFLGTTDLGYDGMKRVSEVFYYDGGGAPQTSFAYTYDPESNITSETRLHDLGLGDVWVYDSAYRMSQFKRDVANPAAEAALPGTGGLILRQTDYTLDRVGNWLEQTINDLVTGTSGTFGNTPNLLNEYGEKPDDGIADDFFDDLGTGLADGVNLAHDLNGNMVREGLFDYLYDAFNRLIEVRDAGATVETYAYDALNRRTIKRSTPFLSNTRYLYDCDSMVEEFELDPIGVELFVKRRYFYGSEGTPLAYYDDLGSQLFYLHEDARGNIRAVTDGIGNVVERYTYGAYGAPEFRDAFNAVIAGATSSPIGNPFLYGSRYYDVGTQFYEQRGAVFAPRFGRHLQRFVPGEGLGPLGQALNPPLVMPNLMNWIGMNPWWWCKVWFWNPGVWWGGWWAWRAGWWWGGAWGWWWWRPWLWFGAPDYGWYWLRPWNFWWGAPWRWWGWQAFAPWTGWWGWWPWWGWGGWSSWFPVWGWRGWVNWWPWWGWNGWCGFWPGFGWWGWCGWWPGWNIWWSWKPWHWWGWWTWTPWWWSPYWSWSGLSNWWNWWAWIDWWPYGWWNWLGWRWWWGWNGWNPWWWRGWWDWSYFGWMWGLWSWWGPIGWWPWYGWGWLPWWWWGNWGWFGWWDWWIWPWWGWGLWGWAGWWNWGWGWWAAPWWGWWRWWGWSWPWWGWWC